MKIALITDAWRPQINGVVTTLVELVDQLNAKGHLVEVICLLYTSPSPRDLSTSRMPSSA